MLTYFWQRNTILSSLLYYYLGVHLATYILEAFTEYFQMDIGTKINKNDENTLRKIASGKTKSTLSLELRPT